ncbi:iron ABC transporter ATP-binding protein [Candidatus Saccharibacteria bacterium]|nr:iron ABC transporter ATP-binding protein [Candidatus Saccharibacteria bacterium]
MKEMLKIVRYSAKLWPYYLAITFFVVVLSLLNLATPFITKGLIDGLTTRYSGGDVKFEYFLILLGLMFLANLTITLLSNVNGFLGDNMSAKLNSLLSNRYFNHLMSLPISYYDNELTGKITARLERSITTISTLMQTLSNNFVQFFLTTAITLVVIAIYSWPVALLLVIIFPTYIWITHLSSKSWQKAQEGINKDLDAANGRFVESIAQVRVVKSFVSESRELNFFGLRRKSIERQTKKQSAKWHRYDVIRRVILNLVFFFIYFVIIYQAYQGRYGLGTVVLLITLVLQAEFPLFGSSFIIDALQRASAGSKDYFEVMNTSADIKDQEDAKKIKVKDGKVEYNSVDFYYNKGSNVLKDISFIIEPGQKLALVGESGEGKSTIANLLLRFYEAQSGTILIDGQDINSVTQNSLRSAIGVVFQEPLLFSGTVRENIAYSNPNIKESEIVSAAKSANAYDFIKKLPKGLNTEIGERGVKLSGGQKQRIAIARAIIKNPKILILDEATSSLDSKAEAEVQQALERLMKDRTTLIIAHRLSTIANVDTVVGIKGGKVIEIGSPSELAKAKGIYAELLKLQGLAKTEEGKAKLKKYDMA